MAAVLYATLMQADRSVERRMAELAARASRTGIAQVAWFLSPAEQAQAEISAKKEHIALFFEGGSPDAERRVAAFAEDEADVDWSIACLHVTWHSRYGTIGHRDLLGSILGLGFGREKIGDLFIRDGEAFAFVLRDVGTYIAANLERAGNVPVRVEMLETWPVLSQGEGDTLRATVASPRLDVVLGAIWNLPRTRAQALVQAGKVQVNHQLELRPDRQLEADMVLSVRGMGRARLTEIGGTTRKGRTAIRMMRF